MRSKTATSKGGQPRQRVQVSFTQEACARLKEIRQLADVKTNAELVRNSLRLYEWFLKQRRDGYAFQIVKDNKVKEVELGL